LLDGISDIIHGLMDWVTHFAYTPYGEWALFGIAFAESSFFPIPPDVLLMALAVARPGQPVVRHHLYGIGLGAGRHASATGWAIRAGVL
jgi:membrane protein YqaA with SNARE-associated domain